MNSNHFSLFHAFLLDYTRWFYFVHARIMIFTIKEYQHMKSVIEDCIENRKPVDVSEAIKIGVDYDSMISLYSQIFIKHQIAELKNIRGKGGNKWRNRLKSYSIENESLMNVSNEYKLGSMKFVKMYMDYIHEEESFSIPHFLANPNIVQSEILRHNLLKLIDSDPLNSPEVDLLKECVGREYEELLNRLLTSRNMIFETEAQLRAKGKPKTPDVLFSIPMAITVPKQRRTSSSNTATAVGGAAKRRHSTLEGDELISRLGSTSFDESIDMENPTAFLLHRLNEAALQDDEEAPASPTVVHHLLNNDNDNDEDAEDAAGTVQLVIHWIDSKAMFADSDTFKEHLDQFKAYNNRYGRGLVIYWHGMVEDVALTEDIGHEQMIVLTDRFPDTWIFPTGESADGRMPQFSSSLKIG